ncbi:MAG: 5'-nucleotidase C-terminal domain-containing protein, partial [Sphaerochaetaceae bacterium]
QGIASANGNAVGENGGFLQVSGLKFTIDTSVPTPVKLDANLMFAGIEGPHRIKDVLVLNAKGEYEPLDLEKTYTVASHNYMIKQGGDGYTMFKDNELVLDETMIDNQVLITYITEYLGGVVPAEYTEPQGRITVK